jgi:hypothetical protein
MYNNFIEYFKRNITLTFILLVYIMWSIFIFYLCHNFRAFFPKPFCGAAGAGLLMFIIVPFGFCFLISLIFMLNSKGQDKKDYQKAFVIIALPLIIALIDIFN